VSFGVTILNLNGKYRRGLRISAREVGVTILNLNGKYK